MAIHILDGIATGIFGVVSVRVNRRPYARPWPLLTLGTIGMAVGIGASLSQIIVGGILYFWMPKTGDNQSSNRANPIP